MANRIEQIKSGSKPYYVNLRFGAVFDSRVGATSGGDNENGDRALALSFAAGWQVPLEGVFGLRIDYGGYADFHDEYDEYDVFDQSFSLEPQWIVKQFIFSLPLIFNYAMENGKTNYNRYTIMPTMTYMVPDTSQAISLYLIGTQIVDRDNDHNLDENGRVYGCGGSYMFFLNDKSRVHLSLDYQESRYDVRVVDYGTDSISNAHRQDKNFTAGVDIQYQLSDNLAIYSNYSFTHSNSNVSVFHYERSILNLGIAFSY